MISSDLVSKNSGSMKKNLLSQRYDAFCQRQEGKEFLWYSIAFISLIGSIMPLSLMAMYFTPWFYPYVFVAMLLFFSNILTIIGKAPIKMVISVYLSTVFLNLFIPLVSFLILSLTN